jgi:FixJ family two-component response regulator
MPRALLVSVIEDDRLFRDSMRRLMRSLGYAVEALLFCSRFPNPTSIFFSVILTRASCSLGRTH